MQISAWREPEAGPSSYRLAWVATGEGGHPLGIAYLRVPTAVGTLHRAEVEVQVHPAERQRGAGSALLDKAVEAARKLGRRTLITGPVTAGPVTGGPVAGGPVAGDASFLIARGFRPVLNLTFSRLPMARAGDPRLAALAGEPHPGYRLNSWEGTVAGDLAPTFAASRRAMDDMPMDEADVAAEEWDVDRVRAIAAAVTERGDILCTVAAMHEPDGAIVGFTELVVPGDGTGDAQHYGTGVLPGHRGRGLARWMKATAVLHVRDAHPGIEGLLTDTAESNVAMRRVNDDLGYEPTHRSVLYQLDL
ncbi:GNAT family N-acetyltransferase [Couchioplanes caeruleus]|uniref:GNAT family N-acetyltransferase n=2 Tax=Couchioplanes caeruleus TaxID=56438 RepID=A0A1K0FHL2_9ACTN|nr:GNAT family N-acetyltransferase [Couchioplanes caeruleus]OJF12317.1 GNAT family N-acetyltransferase [Couchioplanes caeruleus subsp. caeruleus]ROP34504.1 acetyltransferase (GNAT) family protein [Couchioplanes caeruleus]